MSLIQKQICEMKIYRSQWQLTKFQKKVKKIKTAENNDGHVQKKIKTIVPDQELDVHVGTLHSLLSQDWSGNDDEEESDYEYVEKGVDSTDDSNSEERSFGGDDGEVVFGDYTGEENHDQGDNLDGSDNLDDGNIIVDADNVEEGDNADDSDDAHDAHDANDGGQFGRSRAR